MKEQDYISGEEYQKMQQERTPQAPKKQAPWLKGVIIAAAAMGIFALGFSTGALVFHKNNSSTDQPSGSGTSSAPLMQGRGTPGNNNNGPSVYCAGGTCPQPGADGSNTQGSGPNAPQNQSN